MTVAAVMQPYFMPYGGYFRLIAAADVFVVFDCVQFPRRGWVHRNLLPDANGAEQWLTLPLRKAPREARIADLAFADDAGQRMAEQWRRFPALAGAGEPAVEALKWRILAPEGDVVAYLMDTLGMVAQRLGLETRFVRSSRLHLDDALRGETRVRAAARAVDAEVYVNASGGRELYDRAAFAADGLDLRFLPPWTGPGESVLQLLASGRGDQLAQHIADQARLEA